MADYTQTLYETVRTFGPGPSTKWGTAANDVYVMTWGVDYWGEGSEDLTQVMTKVIDDTETVADAVISVTMTKLLSDSIPIISDDIVHAYLKLGDFYHVFISQTTDADAQSVAVYTKTTNPSTSYTAGTVPTTTWL